MNSEFRIVQNFIIQNFLFEIHNLLIVIAVQNKILGVQTETPCGPFGERALQRYL